MSIGPFTKVVAKTKAKAKDFNAALTTIEAKFAGQISSDDLSPTAGIKGTQLSSTAGTRITEQNIEEGAVTTLRLKSDPAAGSPLAAVSTANHIKDGIITNSKFVVGSILGGSLKLQLLSRACSGTLAVGHALIVQIDATNQGWNEQPVGNGYWPLSAWLSKAGVPTDLVSVPYFQGPHVALTIHRDSTSGAFFVTMLSIYACDFTGYYLNVLLLATV
jgi:hypothetical protein